MYHCHVQFYLLTCRREEFDLLKAMPPLEAFTHTFSDSDRLQPELATKADVILADLRDRDGKETLEALAGCRKEGGELILLAEQGQAEALGPALEQASDVWTLPMGEAELRFRFLRWQQAYRRRMDAWQTSQFLEATIDHIPNLIWYKTKDGIHEKVNDSFCKTVNKTKAQVEGRRHAYIWDVEQDDPACIESERIVMTKRETCVSEETVMTGDGTKLLTTYKSPLYDLDGSVMGTVGVAIDVTQERTYEQEIIQKNQTLETIFTTLDCGVMRHTVDGSRILSVNRAALSLLGYSSQEEMEADGFHLIAQTVLDEDKDTLRNAIRSLKKPGDTVNVEYRVRHPNGELLYIMGSIKLLEENGELFYQRFLLDYTEQKLQVNREEQHHHGLIQALSIDYNLVCHFDLDSGKGTCLRINGCPYHVLNQLFGAEPMMDDSAERYINSCVYTEDREMMRQALSRTRLKQILAENSIFYTNYRTLCNGEMRYFQLKAVRAGSWEERHSIVLGLRSVDQETRNEMEKKHLLENALADANRANHAKSIFLSNMSHDIRTPMNAIIGFTTLAQSHMDHPEQVAEYLKKIMASGNHLLNLINDVLDMSHIESGKIRLEEKQCSLPQLLQGLRNIVQSDVQAKQLTLEEVGTKELLHRDIFCDQLRLNQIFLNLLSNAIKYTNPGGAIRVSVSERPGESEGTAFYDFQIRDTGIGMDQDFIAHIFEPFERERNSTISGIQGTGLGMAITKNLVDLMNGVIAVESQRDVGTCVTVSLPFRLAESAESGFPACAASGPDRAPLSRSGRILLTEDNELNQEIAVAILGEAGFEVEVAENGQVAVDKLTQAGPGYYRLILMDVQMPVMNGYQASATIRALPDPALSSIPIIAMTANAFEEDKQEALRHGMNGHIAKPIDVDILFETLDSILK